MRVDKAGKSIVVTGITGSQGGAAARKLIKEGWRVRGLTRNPESGPAKALSSTGVEMLRGDMGDRASLEKAFLGAHGVYAVTDFFRNGVANEVAHGRNVADAALKAGVKHLVFSSVASADRGTGVPHFESKRAIEMHIEKLRLPATILRPVTFMEDLTERKYVPPANWGMIARLSGERTRIKWVALEDIGAMVAAAFSDPEAFIGRKLPLAGDEKSISEAREIFKRVDGKAPFHFSMPAWLFRRLVNSDLVEMWLWFRRAAFDASVEATREILPGLKDMETWLRQKRAASVR